MPGSASLLGSIAQSMHALSERQRVIAQNVANSETPGFQARETVRPDFSALLKAQGEKSMARIVPPQVRITSGMAALGARQPDGGAIVRDADTGETKPDGNNVVLEEQLLKMGQVQADFAAMTSIYRKQINILKTAAGRGGG